MSTLEKIKTKAPPIEAPKIVFDELYIAGDTTGTLGTIVCR